MLPSPQNHPGSPTQLACPQCQPSEAGEPGGGTWRSFLRVLAARSGKALLLCSAALAL